MSDIKNQLSENFKSTLDDLMKFNSTSYLSNVAISNYLIEKLQSLGFEIETVDYIDRNKIEKRNVVAKFGQGEGGLAFFCHSDTVPAEHWPIDPFKATYQDGKIYGRGSCDMKGPIVAALEAFQQLQHEKFKLPLYFVITADEELGGNGGVAVVEKSRIFKQSRPKFGIVTEPTRLTPIYAHKGFAIITVTAHGEAGHTSNDKGISSNYKITPFLNELYKINSEVKNDSSYWNTEFSPPTIGFNYTINDFNCAPNAFAEKTECRICYRIMPNDRSKEILERITTECEKYGLDLLVEQNTKPFYNNKTSDIVKSSLEVTNKTEPSTVSFGTDAFSFAEICELVVLGPGDIAQAHTVNEWIEISQLTEGISVYSKLITKYCL